MSRYIPSYPILSLVLLLLFLGVFLMPHAPLAVRGVRL